MPPQNFTQARAAATPWVNPRRPSRAIATFLLLTQRQPGTRSHRRIGIMALSAARKAADATLQPLPAATPLHRPFELPSATLRPRWSDSRGLAIKGIILGIIFAPVGLVTSIVALKRQRTKATHLLSIGGIVVSIIGLIVLGVLAFNFYQTVDGSRQHNLDTTHQDALSAAQSLLESVFISNGTYPTLAQLNSSTWRSQNLRGVDPKTLAPGSAVAPMVSGPPSSEAYAYNPSPSSCSANAKHPCTTFTLSARLSNGKIYSIQ